MAETPEATRLRKAAASLAEKERELHARSRELDGSAAKLKAFEDAQASLAADPLAYLQQFGVTPDALLDRLIANKAKPEPTADERVAALEKQIADDRARAAEEARVQRVGAHRDAVVQAVQAGGEKYDLVNSLGQHDLVVETIYAYARTYGTVIDPDVAAAQVEKFLETGLSKSKKYGPRAVEPVKPVPAAKKPATTLATVETAELPASGDGFSMDDDERMDQVLKSLGIN